MKKFARVFCVIMLSVVLGVSCFTLTACPKPVDEVQPDPLVFSIGQTDNVFNPFFHSSAYDSEITGQTQISMLSTDKDGNPVCGPEEPTVTQNFRRTVWLNNVAYSTSADEVQDVNPDIYTADQYYTTYQFLIKNNIKFSDGEDLTIKDVIFNLYTYLDPSYIGTSTMYSTKIRGLQDYRTQTPNADESKYQGLLNTWNVQANRKISNMRMAYPTDSEKIESNRATFSESVKNTILEDVETVRNMFWDEVVSDYNSAVIALDGYLEQNAKQDENDVTELGFTEVWEVFLYEAGFIKADIDPKTGVVDLTDASDEGYDKYGNKLGIGVKNIDYGEYGKYWHDRESLIKFVFNAKMGIYDESNGNPYGNAKYDADHCIKGVDGEPDRPQEGYGINTDIITEGNGSDKAVGSSLSEKDNYKDLLWNSSRLLSNLYTILTYYGTANTAREQFVGEARTAYFKGLGGMAVGEIPGVKVLKLQNGDTFDGEFGETKITEDQYVLQIEVEKVDPQAIFNFGFTVAPMHYYSNADNDTSKTYTSAVDYRSFHYPIYEGVENKDGFLTCGNLVPEDKNYNADKNHKFTEGDAISVGRPFSDLDYFNKVLKASNVLFVPVGAGMYKVASYNLFDEYYTPDQRPTFTQFFSNNIAYYVRNPYFYTTSGEGKSEDESSINNCKIKFIRYQIISTSQLLNAILQGTVDYGDPTASQENMQILNSSEATTNGKIKVEYMEEDNNGYGYIGINPKYVPDREIRQAIMHAMDLNYITTYYGRYAELIYRPISTVSWASPQHEGNAHQEDVSGQYYQFDSTGDKYISSLVAAAGYKGSAGSAYKKTVAGETRELKYTFTIAGASNDHPAYKMMQEAAKILNNNGFEVKVVTDNLALSKLAAGELQVWAAAWSSSIDPDMYQLYHKDSTASTTRNWGYPEILANPTKYPKENEIINTLSDLIIKGRTVFDRETRADIYFEAYNQVMELAVELPTYQRKNVYAYNANKVDSSTFLPDSERSAYKGPLSRFWTVELK